MNGNALSDKQLAEIREELESGRTVINRPWLTALLAQVEIERNRVVELNAQLGRMENLLAEYMDALHPGQDEL